MPNFTLINLINKKILNSELRINLLVALLMIVTASILEVVSIELFCHLLKSY